MQNNKSNKTIHLTNQTILRRNGFNKNHQIQKVVVFKPAGRFFKKVHVPANSSQNFDKLLKAERNRKTANKDEKQSYESVSLKNKNKENRRKDFFFKKKSCYE
jgi:hypothetical protein